MTEPGARGQGGDHYFAPSPRARSQPATVRLALPDLTLDLTTDRGVFSAERVDPGTRLLLTESAPPPPAGNLVDLGCGYGPAAITLARRSPAATVWAIDVNRRALDLTRANAAAAGVANVVVAGPDDVPDDLVVAGLWSNPPVRIGKAALQDLLSTWLARLGAGAPAWLVVHRHLGSDSLARWLAGCGYSVERRVSRQGYRVLEVRAG
ncbi:MAG: class I SAM-dependent methyltransferase [Acidimicrobiales bacterium]